MNKEEGFVGTGLRKDEYVADCSDIDDFIVFFADGTMQVSKVDAKIFVGKDIIHVGIFKKNDSRMVYNMIYKLPKNGASYIKRFAVTSVTRDRKYSLTSNVEHCQVLYFSANANGEAEVVTVVLRSSANIKKLKWDIDFADVLIKGRASKGNLVSKRHVKKVEFKDSGKSTLKPRELWYDSITRSEERGDYLGAFKGDDLLLIVTREGLVKTTTPDLALHMPDNLLLLEKWIPLKPLSVLHYEGERQRYYLKRFLIEQELKEELVISETKGSELITLLTDHRPMIRLEFVKPRGKDPLPDLNINVEDFISVKGIKALGNQVSTDKIKQAHVEEPLPFEEVAIDNEKEKPIDDDSSSEATESNDSDELTLF